MLPLQPCREQTDPHGSVEAQFLLKGAVDAAQPTSISLQAALPGRFFPPLAELWKQLQVLGG